MAYKVIIWAPGLVGGLALVETLRHRDLELVGVFAFSEHKDGVDAAMRALLAQGEFLLVTESLLSTAGKEMAMVEDLASCISQLNECVTFVCSPKSPPRQLPAGADVGEAADAEDMINSVVGVRCVTSTELEVQMELEPSSYALLRAPSESTSMRRGDDADTEAASALVSRCHRTSDSNHEVLLDPRRGDGCLVRGRRDGRPGAGSWTVRRPLPPRTAPRSPARARPGTCRSRCRRSAARSSRKCVR